MNGIIRMIVRMALQRGLMTGIRGIASWWGNKNAEGQSKEEATVTRQQARKSGQNVNRLVRMMRRFGRF